MSHKHCFIPGRLESTSSTSLTRRIESVDANVRTQITPRINASGIIELALEIEVSEFKEDSTDSPDKSNRLIKTRTSMAAGEVLVLGGLTSSTHNTSDWKVPILETFPSLAIYSAIDQKHALRKISISLFDQQYSSHILEQVLMSTLDSNSITQNIKSSGTMIMQQAPIQ